MGYSYKLPDLPAMQEDLDKCSLVFTYGTLKMGRGNDRLLHRHESTWLGDAITQSEDYVMGNVGCPYIFTKEVLSSLDSSVPEDLYGAIQGDLWTIPDVDCLLSLDSLEGHPSHYTRRIITVIYEGEEKEAWAYEQNDPTSIYHCYAVQRNEHGHYEW